eukprot:gene10278-2697_t
MNATVITPSLINYSIIVSVFIFGSVLSLIWLSLPYIIILFQYFQKSYTHIREFAIIKWYINLLEKRCEEFQLETVSIIKKVEETEEPKIKKKNKKRIGNIILDSKLNDHLYFGKFKNDRNIVIKKVAKTNEEFVNNEITHLIKCDGNSNVVRYFMKEEDEHFFYLVLEPIENTLDIFLTEEKLTKQKRSEIFIQILKGIQFLHSLNISHCNIEASSIFLTKDNLIKFGNLELSSYRKTPSDEFFENDIKSAGKLFKHIIESSKFKMTKLEEDLINEGLTTKISIEKSMDHALFWEDKMKLNLICNASAYLCSQSSEDAIKLNQFFENEKNQIFEGEWSLKVDQVVIENVCKYRKYDFNRLVDLIRFIRNIHNHLNEYEEKVQEILTRKGIFRYFDKKFPNLFYFVFKNFKN